MHILLKQKKTRPLVEIERIQNLLTNYKYIELDDGKGSGSVLIDEDLFVYIVERYDGISRMMELSENVNDRSGYLSRHIYEINKNGFSMLSN